MKLKLLRIKNYRSFEDSKEIPFHPSTIFVGENSSGKTSTLDCLDLLLNNTRRPSKADFIDETKPISIISTFELDNDTQTEIQDLAIDDKLTVKCVYALDGSREVFTISNVYTNTGFNTYNMLTAGELKQFAQNLGITPATTIVRNLELIGDWLNKNAPEMHVGDKSIKWDQLKPHLPIYQRYSSSDYGDPQAAMQKTLSTQYREHFYSHDADGNQILRNDLTTLKTEIETSMNRKIEQDLLSNLSHHMPDVMSVKGEYDIDFTKGFGFLGLRVTMRDGRSKMLRELGEGQKKKAFLSILEWDRALSTTSDGHIIKAYDEPDANLDFGAQRQLYATIQSNLDVNNKVSVIICTHSLALIDRASARSINKLLVSDGTYSSVSYLEDDSDEDIRNFLTQVAEVSGFKNSSVFYEKAFLVVEGESEEASMHELYKTYTGRSLAEDGIVLINLQTNGQWKNALKFLNKNRAACTVMLLDSDTQFPGSDCQVTKEKLEDIGFSATFLVEQCFFIGIKEFEDTYSDSDLCIVCNNAFPKNDGTAWVSSDFTSIRSASKFSDELRIAISRSHGSRVGKPMIALEMARYYAKSDIEANTILRNIFDKVKGML